MLIRHLIVFGNSVFKSLFPHNKRISVFFFAVLINDYIYDIRYVFGNWGKYMIIWDMHSSSKGDILDLIAYSKYSKILNTICLLKRTWSNSGYPDQTASSSDQGLPCLLFCHFIWEQKVVFEILEHLSSNARFNCLLIKLWFLSCCTYHFL